MGYSLILGQKPGITVFAPHLTNKLTVRIESYVSLRETRFSTG